MEKKDDEGEPGNRHLFFYALIASIILSSCHPPEPPAKSMSYTVPAGNAKAAKKPVPKPVAVKKKKKKIYLTFDDGPNKGTKNVLDIVQQENIPVSFFIVGEHVFASSGQNQVWDSLKIARNIEICNHSYTHAHNRYDKFYEQPGTVVRDMERTRDSLLPNTSIVRAPGRNSWRIDSLHFTDIKKSKAAMDSLQQAGFIVIGWDLEWHYDPKTFQVKNSADEILNQIDSLFKKGKTKYPDNLVLLAHDQVYHSAADSLQLREFIQKLKLKEEYELSLVSSYPAIAGKMNAVDSLKAVLPNKPPVAGKPATSDTL